MIIFWVSINTKISYPIGKARYLMKGSYEVVVQSRRLQYKFIIRRNITSIKGNSATGKTTLLEMIQEYNDNGWESGVTVKSARECVVLSGRFWQSDLKNISNSIVFIDEGARFTASEEFASAIKESNNYYVIVTRERLENIPYSVNEIYGIRMSGKYSGLKLVYNELYTYYDKNTNTANANVNCILTEASNSGYQFFKAVAIGKAIDCIPAGGKSNIFSWLLQHSDENILIIADGAAFGPEMSRVNNFMKHHPNISLYLPESFEWLLLSSKLLDDGHIIKLLANPADYVESSKFFSWEQFFTNELINLTKGTIWQYSKGKLNNIYLNKTNIEKILLNVPITALTEVKS